MKKRGYYGTAKIIDRSADKTPNVEQTVGHGPLPTHATTAFDSLVRIAVVSYRTRLADADGISAKYAIDGLVYAGVIKDDCAKYVQEVAYSQVKVKTRSEEKTEIIVEVVK